MAEMTITFGLHLDGQRAIQPANRLGNMAVGPLGLLTILETQLGMLAEHPSHAERIVQYRNCLALADAPSRFYHATFATDALGTAATLLKWRDLWYLHGWDGQFSAAGNDRLTDLSAVEQHAQQLVSPSLGERLFSVMNLMETRKPAIDLVRLVDPLDVFPKRWRNVLEKLPTAAAGENGEVGAGFLGKLQSNLLLAASGQKFEKLPWQNDGTVTVVQGETRFLAGSWLASQIDADERTLVLASSDAAQLDALLVNAGRARHGLKESSAFRPSLQVLPLALEVLWEPLNFHGLVQFLTHPVCPLPGFARRRLAAKVADAPGVGGKSWEAALVEIDKHFGESEAPAIRQKIRQWVEHPRYRQNDGAPLTVVLQRIEMLTAFFRARLGDEDRAQRMSFNAGFSQCRACAESIKALHAQGVETLRPRQLQRLVAQATAYGTDNPMLVSEVGAQLAITHPGAAVEPIDRVIWWQLVTPVLPVAYPWSSSEIKALAAAGVALPSSDDRLAQTASEWLRPVKVARKQLTLVLPRLGEEVHPVWQMIEAVASKPVIHSLESFLTAPAAATEPVAHKPLPAPKRWWKLPADITVPLREKESFSSLELLLFNPYHWLLRYPAALRPSRILAVPGDFLMLGKLAHGLVELFYQRADALRMSEQDFEAWFAPAFDQLVTEEGALLQTAGRGADLEGFRHRLRQSMRTLRQQVAKAGVVRVDPEMEVAGLYPGGALAGSADLVMQKANGEHAIVDMKWSGAKKYPEKLKQNRHLQLAIYAELLRQKTGAWPSVAYYILDRARFFAAADRSFPDAEVVHSDSGENTAQLWQRFVESWRWRTAQIASGCFEVALGSIEESSDSSHPETAMTNEYLNEAYNDYRALAGWES